MSLVAAVEAANDTIYPVLADMRWAFLSAGGSEEFLTCDNPVSWVDPTLPPGFFGSGLGMKQVELTFPVGPNRATPRIGHESPPVVVRKRIEVTCATSSVVNAQPQRETRGWCRARS